MLGSSEKDKPTHTRRDFLKLVGTGTVGLAFGPRFDGKEMELLNGNEPLVNMSGKDAPFLMATNFGVQVRIWPHEDNREIGGLPKMTFEELLDHDVFKQLKPKFEKEGIKLVDFMGEGGKYSYPWWQVRSDNEKGRQMIYRTQGRENNNKSVVESVLKNFDSENEMCNQMLVIPPYEGKNEGVVIWGSGNDFKVKKLKFSQPVYRLEPLSDGVVKVDFEDSPSTFISIAADVLIIDDEPFRIGGEVPITTKTEDESLGIAAIEGGGVVKYGERKGHLTVSLWNTKKGKFDEPGQIFDTVADDGKGNFPVFTFGEQLGVIGIKGLSWTREISQKNTPYSPGVVLALYDELNYRREVSVFGSPLMWPVASGKAKPRMFRETQKILEQLELFGLGDNEKGLIKETVKENPSMVFCLDYSPLFILVESGSGFRAIENPNNFPVPAPDVFKNSQEVQI